MKVKTYKDLENGISETPRNKLSTKQKQVMAVIINYYARFHRYPSINKITYILSSIGRTSISSIAIYERILWLVNKGYLIKNEDNRFQPTQKALDIIYKKVISKYTKRIKKTG